MRARRLQAHFKRNGGMSITKVEGGHPLFCYGSHGKSCRVERLYVLPATAFRPSTASVRLVTKAPAGEARNTAALATSSAGAAARRPFRKSGLASTRRSSRRPRPVSLPRSTRSACRTPSRICDDNFPAMGLRVAQRSVALQRQQRLVDVCRGYRCLPAGNRNLAE